MAGKGSSTFNISLRLLDQNFKKGISSIQKQIKGLGNFIRGAFALGSITAFGRQMIQVTKDFEDGMARVQAVSNASAADMQKMAAEAKRLGASTRYTATEAASALENLTRNGMSASQATTALSGVLQLAQANAIGLAEAADIVSNSLNMFGLEASETTRVNDVLSSVASTTATNIQEIYSALVNAAPAAKTLGMSIEETTAAIGALAQRGVKAEQAGTALRTALTKMVDPKIVAKMNDMGVAISEQTIKSEGLLGTVKRLKDAQLSLSDLVTIFSQRGAVGVQQLIDAYDTLELELEVTKKSAGTTARMFEQGVGSVKQAIDTLKSTYEAFLISLGEKTSGAVMNVIKLLTNLIKNFDSLTGTILNIASVIVPLFTKRIVTMVTTFKAEMAKAVTAAAALKATMGDWLGIVISLSTWLITGLYANSSKVNEKLREQKKRFEDLTKETETLRIKVNGLIGTLGDPSDKETLAGVVQQLVSLFPEFENAITSAAAAAGDTAGYQKLEETLDRILKLQAAVSANKLLEETLNIYDEKLYNNIMKRAANGGTAEGQLFSAMKGASGEDTAKTIMHLIATSVNRNTSENAMKEYAKSWMQMYFGDEMANRLQGKVEEVIRNAYGDPLRRESAEMQMRIKNNNAIQSNIKKEFEQEEENAKKEAKLLELRAEAEKRKLKYDSSTTAEELQKMIDKDIEAEKRRQAANLKGEDLKKEENKIQADLDRTLLNLKDDLKNGKFEKYVEYLNKCADAQEQAYNKYRDLHGENGTGEKNPYYNSWQEAKGKVAKSITLEKPNVKINEPKLEYKGGNQGLVGTNRPKGEEPDLAFISGMQTIRDWNDEFVNSINAADTLAYSLQGLSRAWDTLGSSSATAVDKFAASIQVLHNIAMMAEGLVEILDILGLKEIWEAKIHEWATHKKLADDSKSVIGSIAKAVVGAISSVVEIPVVGPVLAVAAAAGILGLIAATVPKFASGGIISGGSNHGDNMIAKVNSGEMILNKQQQKRLFDMANGGGANGAGAGQVEFFISGKNLKGVLRNVDNANARIQGAKGL